MLGLEFLYSSSVKYMTQHYTRIDVNTAAQKLQLTAITPAIMILDIRDPIAYQTGHIPHALHLTDQNLSAFLAQTDRLAAVLVYCYHGHSSQQAAQFLADQGFTEIYSLNGGFAAWQTHYPHLVEEA